MPRRVVFGENEPSGGPEASKFQEISFRGVPKPQNFKKQAFGGSRSSKNLENKLSGSPEASKFQETSFRGVPKLGKFGKQAFGESRSLKISKNKLSGSPEARKISKTAPRGAPKRANVIFPSAKCWLKAENAGC